MVVAIGGGGLLLAGMIALAGYAIRTLPADARVPLNVGLPERSAWLSRRAGLGAWLGIGAAAYAALAWLTVSGASANWLPAVRAMLLPCVMLVVAAAQAGAVITARKRVADGAAGIPRRAHGGRHGQR